jgi:soluble lytic murein transglycosylase-like protein
MAIIMMQASLWGFTSSRTMALENVCEREMLRAATIHDIPVGVLYAVALTETGHRGGLNAYAMNVAGRPVFNADLHAAMSVFASARENGVKLIDIGCMQINHHFHGRNFPSVEAMFDPRRNVDYAAIFLKRLQAREGSWTGAVARYHAGPNNAPAQKTYVCAVIRNMVASGFGAWTPESQNFCRS